MSSIERQFEQGDSGIWPELGERSSEGRRSAAEVEDAMSTAVSPLGTGGVRLTRRGRSVVFLAVLVAALAVLVALSGPALSIDITHHSATRTVVVRPGETLWDIASRTEPGVDPRDVIAQIVAMNSLPDGGTIRVGQPLVIPAN